MACKWISGCFDLAQLQRHVNAGFGHAYLGIIYWFKAKNTFLQVVISDSKTSGCKFTKG